MARVSLSGGTTLLSPALFKKASHHTCVPVWEHKTKKKNNLKNRGKDRTCDVQEHARSILIVVQLPSHEYIPMCMFFFSSCILVCMM